MSEVVLKVQGLSKIYRLGEVGTGTISHDLNRWWAKIRGKEDPYSQVGQVNDRTQKATSDYVQVLDDINFEVKQGDILGIIGKNGAGKSTLLKLISRITAPSTGSIKAKGRIASLLEVGTGMNLEMTARENVYLNGTILGMTKQEIAIKFDEIIEFAGCAMFIDTPVKRFSSGMRVRLGFAVAAFLEPEILIVDEVLAVGDAEFQKKAIGKMKEVSEGEGRTVLFVSHNMASIQHLCTKLLVLGSGTVSFQGNVKEGINYYLTDNYNASQQIKLEDRRDRTGGKEIKLTDIQYEDFEGNVLRSVYSGIDLNVRFFFKAKNRFDELEFRLQFVDQNGNVISTLNNYHSGELLNLDMDVSNSFVCSIPKLPLQHGDFTINMRVSKSFKVLDEIEGASFLEVEQGDFFGTGKIPTAKSNVYINHIWYGTK